MGTTPEVATVRQINRRRLILLPIRIVMLLPFYLLVSLGEWAEKTAAVIDRSRFCPKGLDSF